VFHPSDRFCGPPLDLIQQVHVFPVLRAPELGSGLQVESHQSGVGRQSHLPGRAGYAAFDAAQDMVGLLGCECMLLGHVELLINQHPQVLLLRARPPLNAFSAQPVFVLRLEQKPNVCGGNDACMLFFPSFPTFKCSWPEYVP